MYFTRREETRMSREKTVRVLLVDYSTFTQVLQPLIFLLHRGLSCSITQMLTGGGNNALSVMKKEDPYTHLVTSCQTEYGMSAKTLANWMLSEDRSRCPDNILVWKTDEGGEPAGWKHLEETARKLGVRLVLGYKRNYGEALKDFFQQA